MAWQSLCTLITMDMQPLHCTNEIIKYGKLYLHTKLSFLHRERGVSAHNYKCGYNCSCTWAHAAVFMHTRHATLLTILEMQIKFSVANSVNSILPLQESHLLLHCSCDTMTTRKCACAYNTTSMDHARKEPGTRIELTRNNCHAESIFVFLTALKFSKCII